MIITERASLIIAMPVSYVLRKNPRCFSGMCFRKHNILYPESQIVIRIPEKESGAIRIRRIISASGKKPRESCVND